MKYFCNVNLKMTSSREETIKIMYPRIKIVSGIDELLSQVDALDTVVFDNVLELDPSGKNDIETIINNYLRIIEHVTEISFDRSPNCDYNIICTHIWALEEMKIQFDEEEMWRFLLEMQISGYLNIKDATSNMKKYSQLSASRKDGKSYGRPKGSRKDSEKAIKAKEVILRESKDFNGTLSDEECIPLSGASRNMFYKYKKQLKEAKEVENVSV